jgi:RNA polymerase sigma-70 factor, ECF subfamily
MKSPEFDSARRVRSDGWAMLTIDFDGIARNHCSVLYRRALKLTRNSAQAWDLVQDTFERGLKHFPEQLPATKVQSWLLVILRNLFLDRMRSPESQVRMCGANHDWPALAAPDADEEDGPPRSERFRAEDVRACLDQLPATLRQSYEMHAFGGLSYREIANLLGLRVATVGTRILRARRRLCDLLLARLPATEPAGESAQNSPSEGELLVQWGSGKPVYHAPP